MSTFDFGYLIAPHPPAAFLARYWEKSALVIKRDEAGRFKSLLPKADIQAILSFADQMPADVVELIGKATPAAHKPESPRGLAEFFRNGSTIRVRGIQRYCDPLKEMCRSLEQQLGFPTRANLYCTPANSRGFDLHFDTHEVLVLQLVGRKRWQIHRPAVKMPSASAPLFAGDCEAAQHSGREESAVSGPAPGPLELEELLAPGDSLYVPRGFFHQAVALDEPSVHLTIGIHVLAPPPDFGGAANEISGGLISGQNAAGGPDLELLDHETKLAGNVGLQVYLSADGSMAGLALGQEIFWLPVCFASALRFIAEHQLFCARELPGEITGNSKLRFVRRLVEDGYLRIAD